MGLFSRKPHGTTPAEEAARRRGISVPDDDLANASQARKYADAPASASPSEWETKVLKLPQLDFVEGRTNVEKKLEPYVADGWEVVSQDIKKYGTGGKHTILLRRPRP